MDGTMMLKFINFLYVVPSNTKIQAVQRFKWVTDGKNEQSYHREFKSIDFAKIV